MALISGNDTVPVTSTNLQSLQQAILEKVALNHPLGDTLSALCLEVERVLPHSVCSIMLVDEQTGALRVETIPSGGDTACVLLDGLVPGEFAGACGTAVYTRQLVIIEDTEKDPRWEPIRQLARPLGIRSCWSIPIFSDNQQVVGTFAISHPKVCRATAQNLRLLETASYLASIAIKRIRDFKHLQESEQRYRDLYESAPLAYFTSDMDGRIKSVNARAIQLVGYSEEKLKNCVVLDLYAPGKNGREKAERLQSQIQEEKEIESEELQMQRADGSYVWVNLTVRLVRDSNGNCIERREIAQDITDRKLVEEELRLTKFVIDHAGDTILWTGSDKRIRYANEAAVHSLGYSQNEILGKPITDITATHNPEQFSEQLQDLGKNQTVQYESRHRTKQGDEFPVELTLSAVEHQESSFTCAIVRNITDRKRGEDLLAKQKSILEMISIKDPLSDILFHICKMVESHYPQMFSAIHLLEGNVLRKGAAPSLPDTYMRKLEGISIGPCAGSCGTAAYRKESVMVSDIRTDPLWERGRRLALRHGLQACWSTPIRSSSGVILGTFANYFPEPRTPDQENLELIDIATSLASVAIEQGKAEEALQESEDRYRTLYEDNPTMYFTISTEGTVLSVNQFGASQLGYEVQELIGRSVSMIIFKEDQEAVKKQLKACLEHPHDLAHWQFRKVRKDGSVIWVRETARVVKDQHNNTVFLIVCEDITLKKHAEEKNQEINIALSNAMPGIACVNPDGLYSEVNASYAAMLGTSPMDLIGVSWEPTVHPEDLPSAHAAYREMVNTGKGEFEAKGIRRDGTILYKQVLMVKQVNRNGEMVGHHCFMRDISERKLSEEALRESEERLQDILDNSPAVIYVKDFEGHYILINKEYERIFNLKRDQVKGKTDFDLFSHEIAKAFTDNDKKVLEHGDALELEEVAPHKDGLHTYISNKFLLQNAQGTPYAICGISTDITQRKKADSQLREAYEQTRELSVRLEAAEESERKRIARELHDEFGQMLTGLKFDLVWLLRRLSESQDQTTLPPIIDKLKGMGELTDALIQTIRRIATSLRPSILDDLGLLPALEWQVEDFQKRTGIQCKFSTNFEGQELELENERATALFRIAQELLTNILRHAKASRVRLALEKSDKDLILSIKDNGQGIVDRAPTQIPSLGLLGIKERVTSFGGEFLIHGESGRGTAASVRIPVSTKS